MDSKPHCLSQCTFHRRNGGVGWSKRRHVSVDDLHLQVKAAYTERNEIYHSMHLLKGNESLVPTFTIDIDSHDLNKARISTLKIFDWLSETLGSQSTVVFFSGSKGFHIVVDSRFLFASTPTTEQFDVKKQAHLARAIATASLGSADPGPDMKIYGRNRVLRAANSINLKSGLYKIQLKREELDWTVEQIRICASHPRFTLSAELNETAQWFKSSASANTEFVDRVFSGYEASEAARSTPSSKSATRSASQKVNPSLGSSYEVIERCRAVRQLVQRATSSDSIDRDTRFYFARSLAGTDNYLGAVHEVLSRISGYDRSITDSKLRQLNEYSVSCEELIESSLCAERCSRFLKSDCSQAEGPTYFGNRVQSKWNETFDVSHIRNTASKLIDYHLRTTDFFDWQNAIQFRKNPLLYSESIEISGKGGFLPELTNYLTSVLKPDGSARELTHIHFEAELMSSLFVREIVQRNKRFRDEEVLAKNVYSFGYLEPDESPGGLVRPWIDEYSKFQMALKTVSSNTAYSVVYSDDLRAFYPSISNETIRRLLVQSLNDQRSIIFLESFFGQAYRSPKDNIRVERPIGLPQGPVVSHVLAARLLLEIDKIIAEKFTEDELVLVRYCDDFFFFCRDSEVAKRVRSETIPLIQKSLGVTFHNDTSGSKTIECDRETYRLGRLEHDLFKYQVRFESELAQADPEVRRDLIRLLTNIFGVSYSKILASDPTLNLKETERQLSVLKWRIADLVKVGSSAEAELKDLAAHIIRFLEYDRLSHKMQTTLILLYFALIENVEQFSFELIDRLVDLIGRKIGAALAANIFDQIAREVATKGSVKLIALSRKISQQTNSWAMNPYESYLVGRLQKIEQITSSTDPLNFDVEAWGLSSPAGRPNLARQIKSVRDTELAEEKLRTLFKKAGAEFGFYKAYLVSCARQSMPSLQMEVRAGLYRIGFEFGVSDLKDLFLDQYDLLVVNNLLSVRELEELRVRMNFFKSHVSAASGVAENQIKVERKIGGTWLFDDGKSLYALDTATRADFKERNPRKIDAALSLVNKAFPGQFASWKVDSHTGELIFITTLPRQCRSQFSWYLSDVPIDILVSAEVAFFDCDDTLFSARRKLVLSARNLGLANASSPSHFVISLRGVIEDTATSRYVPQTGAATAVDQKSYFYPAPRLFEAFEKRNGPVDKATFPFGWVGMMMLQFLHPKSRGRFFYRRPERIKWLLEQVVAYRGVLTDNPSGHDADFLFAQSYELYSLLDRQRTDYVFRSPNDRFCGHFSKVLSRVSEIAKRLEFRDGDSTKSGLDLLHDNALLKTMDKRGPFPSLNFVLGYVVLKCCLTLGEKVDRAYDPVVGVLGSTAIYMIHMANQELFTVFGTESSPLRQVEKLCGEYLQQFNSIRKRHFLLPSHSNYSSYSEVTSASMKAIEKAIEDVSFVDGPSLHLISGETKFVPAFPSDHPQIFNFLSENFRTLEVRFDIRDRRFWKLASAKILRTLDLSSGSQSHAVKLSENLSLLHSWRTNSHADHNKLPFVTFDRSSNKVIINSLSNSHFLFPRGLDQSKALRPRWRVRVAVAALALGMSIPALAFRREAVAWLSESLGWESSESVPAAK